MSVGVTSKPSGDPRLATLAQNDTVDCHWERASAAEQVEGPPEVRRLSHGRLVQASRPLFSFSTETHGDPTRSEVGPASGGGKHPCLLFRARQGFIVRSRVGLGPPSVSYRWPMATHEIGEPTSRYYGGRLPACPSESPRRSLAHHEVGDRSDQHPFAAFHNQQ